MNIEQLKKLVSEALKKENTWHDFGHIIRVYNLALKIAKEEKNVDIDVLKSSALLHDLAYTKGFFAGEHGDVSAKCAKHIVLKLNLSTARQKKILEAIRTHNYWYNKSNNDLIEAKILRDADRLEMLGHVGIIREVLYCTNVKKNLMEGLNELLKLENDFETKMGKKLSRTKLKVVKNFIHELKKELL